MNSYIRKPIDSIEFSLLGNNEIKNISAFGKNSPGVTSPEVFENSEPKKGGLIDPRMGTVDENIICATCHLSSTYCGGHFGHVILENYMFNVSYIVHIKKILNNVCLKCSKLLTNKTDQELDELVKNKTGRFRFAEIKNLAKDVPGCVGANGCGTPASKVKIDKKKNESAIRLVADIKVNDKDEKSQTTKKVQQVLSAERCYNILKNISDRDCELMGLDPKKGRPEEMLHKIFPIPPVQVRPAVRSNGTSLTLEDDLNKQLSEIIKKNEQLAHVKNVTDNKYSQNVTIHEQLLQFHLATYIDNENPYMAKTGQKGKPLKSLSSRLKGKEGRFRNNLMGKRVDFSARTVITPDPTIDVNQVGVPLSIVMNLTFPEIVTPYNIEHMKELVKNGPDIYPGANIVIKKRISDSTKDEMIYLKIKRNVELNYGDVVERHLIDGDIVLLNRQPSLHKQSMMGHYVHVIRDPKFSSFRVNVGATAPYNADYDGDEMNITVPQDIQTVTELEELASLERVFISARNSCIIMGLKQDGTIGAYIMSRDTTTVNWRNVMNILSCLKLPKNTIIEKNKSYSGRELFSMILPERVNKSNMGKKDAVNIEHGKLISGFLNKNVLGEEQGNNLIQLILDEYGIEEGKDFFDNSQRLINKFNLVNGFSVGVIDTNLPQNVKDEITAMKNKEILKAQTLVTEIENNPTLFDNESFDGQLKAYLDSVMPDASALISRNIDKNNSFYMMSESGSKGGPTNTGQMIGIMGQQTLEGERVPKRINKRSLPYFHKNDDTAEARGFADDNFLTGMKYPAYVFHLMSAREGLIDTAVKTADTGYTQRKLIKSLEDIMICYDNSVRTATGSFIQFNYGDSCADTTKQHNYFVDMLLLGNHALEKKYKFSDDELRNIGYSSKNNNNDYIKLKQYRDMIRESQIKTKMDYKTFSSYASFLLPVNLSRILDKIKVMKMGTKKLTPEHVFEKIDDVLSHKKTKLVCIKQSENESESVKIKDENAAKTIMCVALYNAFYPKRSILEYKLSEETFDFAMDNIIKSYNSNIAEPGDMVGIIAVQALIPPLTQLTLNTFHQSGVGSKGLSTLGVPRLKELLSLTRQLKTPRMCIYLDKKNQNNKETANRIAAYLKHTTIAHVRSKIDVYYDPMPMEKDGFFEVDKIEKPFYVHNATANSCSSSFKDLPWLIRIEFDREKMLTKDVSLLDILSKFCTMWENRFQDLKKVSKEERDVMEKITRCSIMSNHDNDDVPVMHIRFDMTTPSIDIISDFIETIIDELKLKGIDGIREVYDPSQESYVDFSGNDENVETTKEYTIVSAGINMYDIRYINGIDISRTYCNDVMQIYDIFGIEAARIALLREITGMLNSAGKSVNYHHLSIIVDLMARDGFLISIDRHGMGRTDAAPLGKISFEKPVEQLLAASVFNEKDPLNGVSARIMTGNVIKGGTGLCGIMLDTEMIEKSEYVEDERYVKNDKIDEVGSSLIDDVTGKTHDDIFVPE